MGYIVAGLVFVSVFNIWLTLKLHNDALSEVTKLWKESNYNLKNIVWFASKLNELKEAIDKNKEEK